MVWISMWRQREVQMMDAETLRVIVALARQYVERHHGAWPTPEQLQREAESHGEDQW
jgi:hypothetical protein